MKKLFVFISCFILFFLLVSPGEGQAKNNIMTLTTKDITFWDITPNESVTKSMNKITKKYPKLEFSESEGDYFTGDPTANMNYFLKFYTGGSERTFGVLYEQFNAKKSGLKLQTSKGIKINSSLSDVRAKYGKSNYAEKTDSDPGNNYVYFTYPFILKETGQRGLLTFQMRYSKGAKKASAQVYGIEYKLEPKKVEAKKVEAPKAAQPTTIFGLPTSGTFNGETIKAGMTKKQVLNLIGKPNDIKEPMGGTAEQRELVKSRLGKDQFNINDIEQWTYIREPNGYGTVEATAIFFNYQDVVSEVFEGAK